MSRQLELFNFHQGNTLKHKFVNSINTPTNWKVDFPNRPLLPIGYKALENTLDCNGENILSAAVKGASDSDIIVQSILSDHVNPNLSTLPDSNRCCSAV